MRPRIKPLRGNISETRVARSKPKRRGLVAAAILSIILSSCSNVDEDWKRASQAGTLSALDEFVSKHPTSPYAADAHDRIARLWVNVDPLGVSCEVLSNLDVRVTWPPVAGAKAYFVYRSSDSTFEGHSAHGHVEDNSFEDKVNRDEFGERLVSYYRVAAVRDEGNSRQSRVAAASLQDDKHGTRCQICSKPAKGYCHLRRIYVCEEHNTFLQGDGSYMRCPP